MALDTARGAAPLCSHDQEVCSGVVREHRGDPPIGARRSRPGPRGTFAEGFRQVTPSAVRCDHLDPVPALVRFDQQDSHHAG